MNKDKFQISLRENGEHSFKRSLESYKEYERTNDQMLLKDTIMFLHQSIELLMKEMLVQHSPYLIFEELKDIPKKQKEANKNGIGIFYIDNPPKSVTYEVAIKRVEAFINPPELDDKLIQHLEMLNRLRNQLEHYAINADREEVMQMLEAVHKPILQLFEKHLGTLTQLNTPQINQTWKTITGNVTSYKEKNHEVFLLMQKFNGQKVPGSFFGVEDEVTLPKFDLFYENYLMPTKFHDLRRVMLEIDIFAEFEQSSVKESVKGWIVETKLGAPASETIYKVRFRGDRLESIPWLVAFAKIPSLTRVMAKEFGVMVTGIDELEELKKLIE